MICALERRSLSTPLLVRNRRSVLSIKRDSAAQRMLAVAWCDHYDSAPASSGGATGSALNRLGCCHRMVEATWRGKPKRDVVSWCVVRAGHVPDALLVVDTLERDRPGVQVQRVLFPCVGPCPVGLAKVDLAGAGGAFPVLWYNWDITHLRGPLGSFADYGSTATLQFLEHTFDRAGVAIGGGHCRLLPYFCAPSTEEMP